MNLVPYIEAGQLEEYAASCARTLRPDGAGDGREEARRLRRALRETERCAALLRRRYADAAYTPSACEWLLDNAYMLRREAPGALEALRGAPRQRRCRGRLLISQLCRMLLLSGHGALDDERCMLFLRGFQSVTVLQRRELLLFPAALRAELIAAVAENCRALRSASEPETLTALMAALFSSLRLLSGMDMEELLDGADLSSAILARDPAGVYAKMDRRTRQSYLARLERMAQREQLGEQALAERLIAEAQEQDRHIGFLLFSPPGKGRAALYLSALLLLTLFLSLLFAFRLNCRGLAPLLLVPVGTLVKGLVDFALLHLTAPRPLPRLDPERGVPEEGKTLCVVSALLGCCRAERLEELRLLSRREGEYLFFGLLADLPAAKTEQTPDDEALLNEARLAVDRLNQRYGGGFYLFTRRRSFDGETYSGHERKRGALTELARLLCGESSALTVTGDLAALRGTRYVISLDTDTRIRPGVLGELIAAALHPLNTPVCGKNGVVRRGYGIIHPRIETELDSATGTDFALIFAGSGGSDPYGGLSAELCMDAFDSGGFAGKGLIDVRLLLGVSGRLGTGRVLSHDALEGALLRGGYLSDAAVSDAFPDTPIAYFKRQHRWIRGDWQNAPWIFCRDLGSMERFRLFDNLLRSLLAPATLTALLLGFVKREPGLALAAWAALLALVQSLLLTLVDSGLTRSERGVRLKRHTRVLSGVGGALVRCFMRLWLLPFEAWVSLSAIITALWRMFVSHKRLLQWQTFAELKTERGLGAHVRAMWPAVVLGVLLMAFSPVVIGKSAGLLWLLSPAAAAALALPAAGEKRLAARDRELLSTAVRDGFDYFRSQCTAEEHYLPPDNFQQAPPVGAAHRTSPTNIGLALASAAALGECGMLSRHEARDFIARILQTLEGMERHLGHFYNWYDTRTLLPMEPAMISTVDSGNLCAGLLVTAAALGNWGENEWKKRAAALLDSMDFSPLFDPKRELFYICYDPRQGRGIGGWYDLMASEAMLTSFLAVARGQVPPRHWRRLSRAQLQKDGYRGLASWTGTMFEYLMPALFLPLYRASLLRESALFCLYVQRRRRLPGKPWGVSESAFYALDASMSYRYKAHGCPELALKRGMEADLVVAPYAGFLALAADAPAAARNLRALKENGLYGRFGYYEAVDYTPGRCTHTGGEPVQCWMAHHVGMSILAAVNALEDGLVRRLFLSAPETAAYTLLLQEKLPDDAAVIRRETAEVPERPKKADSALWGARGEGADGAQRAALLSNGVYHLRLTGAGQSAAHWGELCVYRSPGGLSILLDEKPLCPGAIPAVWELGEEQARLCYETPGTSVTVVRQCAEGESGESVLVKLCPNEDRRALLTLDFTPILALERDWDSQCAYWQLGMEAEERHGRLLLHRLSKNGEAECWLCLGADTELSLEGDTHGGLGALACPRVRVSARLSLRRGRESGVHFALCLGRSAEEAEASVERLLSSAGPAAGAMLRASARRLGMTAAELERAMALVLPLWQNRLRDAGARRELWRWGISGELPLLVCRADARESGELLHAFCLLKSCGLEADLVYLSAEAGQYRRPQLQKLENRLRELGLEALLDVPGGVHRLPDEASELIESRAVYAVGKESSALPPLTGPTPPPRGRSAPVWHWEEDVFCYTAASPLPPRIWQHILSDGRLGAYAADFGPAGLFFQNAREMRLLPPPARITDTSGSERVFALVDGEAVSLFADGKSPCEIRYAPGWASWRKHLAGREIETTLVLSRASDVRLLLIRGAAGLELVWELEPWAGGPDASCVQIETGPSCAVVRNPEAYLPQAVMRVSASTTCRFETDFRPAALRVRLKGEELTALGVGCATEEELRRALRPEKYLRARREAGEGWRALLQRLQVSGLDPALGRMVNTWAPYQTLACRLLARTSLYQSGGALGFRDQLQDAVNLMLLDTVPARRQILEACRHQYREGDVMHWWHRHPEGDRGVRTRCSDDLLWLVWALCEYTEATGNLSLCAHRESWLVSPELRADERDRYETPERSAERAPVLEHAWAALSCCVRRGFGKHGLPYMGSGDWNDGLDRVGGESVWLGWFLSCCAQRFAALLESLGDTRAGECRLLAEQVGRAADGSFNGRWYPRAWTAEGKPLADWDRIDSVAQSWAAFCPYASPEKAAAALDSALAKLVDRERRIVKLLAPPYGPEESHGYLSGYGKGFRENGGQYTHAAIWLALAALRLGREREGVELLHMLLPETHPEAIYEGEPFVLPADVCAAPGREGLAGWTWYTGSAGWYFRAVTQGLLGLRLVGGRLKAEKGALTHWSVRWIDPAGHVYHIERDGDKLSVREEEKS